MANVSSSGECQLVTPNNLDLVIECPVNCDVFVSPHVNVFANAPMVEDFSHIDTGIAASESDELWVPSAVTSLPSPQCHMDSCNEHINTRVGDLEASLLHSLVSPLGQVVNVYQDCLNGTCKCIYSIGGIDSQLKPCRFAGVILMGPEELSVRYLAHNRRLPYCRLRRGML